MTETGKTKPVRRRVEVHSTVSVDKSFTAKSAPKAKNAPKAKKTKAPKPEVVAKVAKKVTKKVTTASAPLQDVGNILSWPDLNPKGKKLYAYQAHLIAKVFKAFAAGADAVLMHAPTSAGKSVIAGDIAAQMYVARKPLLLVAHRRELVEQLSGNMLSAGIPEEMIGIINPDHVMDPGQQKAVYVASLDSLATWVRGTVGKRRMDMGKFTLIIIDEAHRAAAASYKFLFNGPAKVLGMTGTPIRHGAGSLADLFDTFVLGPTIQQLIALGKAVPMRYIVPEQILTSEDLFKALKAGGDDYDDAKIAEMMEEKAEKIYGQLTTTWLECAENRQTLVFPPSIALSRGIVARFKANGIPSAHIDGTTPPKQRDALVAKFREGKLKVLSSVGVFIEGFDAPDCSCIFGLTPTKSLIYHLQQMGRGIRAFLGKLNCLYFDFVGNVRDDDLGPVERAQEWEKPGWTLAEGTKANRKKYKAKIMVASCACPVCSDSVLVPLQRTVFLPVNDGRRTARVGQKFYRERNMQIPVPAFYCGEGHKMHGTALPFTCPVCSHHQQISDGTGYCTECHFYDPTGQHYAWAADLAVNITRVLRKDLTMQFGGDLPDWTDMDYRTEVIERQKAERLAKKWDRQNAATRPPEYASMRSVAQQHAVRVETEQRELAEREERLREEERREQEQAEKRLIRLQKKHRREAAEIYYGDLRDKSVRSGGPSTGPALYTREATWFAALLFISKDRENASAYDRPNGFEIASMRFTERFGVKPEYLGVDMVAPQPPSTEIKAWVHATTQKWLAEKAQNDN